MIYKKINSEYLILENQNDESNEILTRYLRKKEKAHTKARNAANASNLANRRAKFDFYNSVNAMMNNYSISAKKKVQYSFEIDEDGYIFWKFTIK